MADLYKEKRYLSRILSAGQLSQREIAELKRNYLEQYLDQLIAATHGFWRKKLRPLEYEMLRTKYALDGKPLASNCSLARLYELSVEKIDKMRVRAVKRLRHQSLIDSYEDLVVQVARDLLAREGKK